MQPPCRLRARIASLLISICAGLGPQTARAEPESDSGEDEDRTAPKVQVRFVFAAENETERTALLDGVERFEAAHPDIDVEPVPFQWRGYGFHDTLVRLLALEDPSIDVYRIDVPWIPELAAPGWLLPLDRWIEPTERARFVPVTIEGGRHRGRLFALPLSLKGNLLFYRSDLLQKHDLSPPETLAELREQASFLRREEGLSSGLALHPAYFYNDVLPMIWASGGGVLDTDGSVILNSETNGAVLAEVTKMVGPGPDAAVPIRLFEGAWSERYSALDADFLGGDAAFAITWSTRWHQQKGTPVEGRVGVMSIPGLEPGQGSSNLGSYYVGVNAFSAHPEEAVAFTRFMTGPEAQASRLELLGEVPALPELQADAKRLAAHPELEFLTPALARGGIRPRVSDERALGIILEEAFHGIVVEGGDIQELLARAAERIRTEIGSIPPSVSSPEITTSPGNGGLEWTRPIVVGAGLIGLFALVLGLLLFVRRTLGWDVFVTLQGKLVLGGAAAVFVLAASSTTVATSLALRAQRQEIQQHRAFFTERIQEQAESLGKSVGLALALLDEEVDDRSTAEKNGALAELLRLSQFTEDVLFAEMLHEDGSLRLSDQYGLYLSEGPGAERPKEPEKLAQLVASRAVHTYRQEEDGRSWVEVVVPLFRSGVHQGALRLGLSRERFDAGLRATEERHAAALRQLTIAIAITGLGLLLVCLFGVTFFARRLARPVEQLTAAAVRVRSGDLAFRIEHASRDEVGTLAEAMSEMVQGLRDRDFIRDAFGRYLTPELAEKLVADPDALMLGGHERTVTILMSDLRGFSSLSERLGPEEMVALLNRYLASMTEVILRHRGMINEFLGDAILVLFGALEAQEDDAERAVRCALDMQQALEAFNRRNEQLGLPRLSMGIGVNTGTVVAGNIGSDQRVKYGVVGPPVNRAARLESLAVGSQIFVSADTTRSCSAVLKSRGPHRVRVKGNEQALEYFELMGIEGAPELDLPTPEKRVVECVLQARFARLEGKRVPEERSSSITRSVGPELVTLQPTPELDLHDSVLLELELPDSGWTRSLWAKVTETGREGPALTLTSVGPTDLEHLERLVSETEIPSA